MTASHAWATCIATWHIQYTTISIYLFILRENEKKTREDSKSAIFVWYENGRPRLLGAQSINDWEGFFNMVLKQNIVAAEVIAW